MRTRYQQHQTRAGLIIWAAAAILTTVAVLLTIGAVA